MIPFEELQIFYNGKRVFLTGHTGFKGAWMCKILNMMGAMVTGYALEPHTSPNVYDLLGLDELVHSELGDIRDYEHIKQTMEAAKPEIVFHLAAQPIVRESYRIPRETFETNVMGTVNILECIREIPGVISFLNVTTDKVYENRDEADHAFTEDEKLDGYDPYSNSKSCSELVTHSYRNSFFQAGPAISTARSGNVIGGGDFAVDRIIPDCVRATVKGETIPIRNPYSVRPFQHVLEPLTAYLLIAMRQAQDPQHIGSYNVGPEEKDCVTTGELANLFVREWNAISDSLNASWQNLSEPNAPHEAGFLHLDCTLLKSTFNWNPVWNIHEAVRKSVQWYHAWSVGEDLATITESQIHSYGFFN